jgi:tetratricopeptide (TPR) repeat protein
MKPKFIFILFVSLNLILCASSQKKVENARMKDPRYQYNMGAFYLNSGNVDEAIKYFNNALSLNPRFDDALCSLGLAYSMKGNFDEAIKNYQACLKVNPNYTEAHNFLGTVYEQKGLLDKAEQEFRIAIADANYRSKELAYYNLAGLYVEKNKLDEALVYAENAIEIKNNYPMGYNLKGMILEKLSRYKEAIESYEKALVYIAKDKDVDISYNLAVAYFKNNELSKARAVFMSIYPRVMDIEMKKKIDEYLKMIK